MVGFDLAVFPSSTHCDCWRLVRPLAPGDPLPDHVCFFTMRETIRRAISSGLLPEVDVWPVRFGGGRVASRRALGFVVRQWVEGEASRALAGMLAEQPRWQEEARHLLSTYRFWREKNPASDESEWVAGTGTKGLLIEDRLKGKNLPYNPATVAHLRAVTAGLDAIRRQSPECQRDEDLVRQPEPDSAAYMAAWKRLDAIKAEPCQPFPAHGILLATYVYIKILPDARSCRLTEIDLATPLEFAKGNLLDAAREIALRQRDWFQEFKQHPLNDRSAIHRAAGLLQRSDDVPDDPHDYLQQALRPRYVDNLREKCRARPENCERYFEEHIRAARDRARKSRKRAYLDTAPPKDWAKETRRRLVALIEHRDKPI